MNFKIVIPATNVFNVVVEDSYDLAMLFCRAQEFYESPNPEFREKHFSIWYYIKWYSQEYNGFTYAQDWSGFNMPLESLERCYANGVVETPYDTQMMQILNSIREQKSEGKAYVIGTTDTNGTTLKHELCHAFYSVNAEYRKKAILLVESIDSKVKKQITKNLLVAGYTQEVVDDEIQAYLMYGHNKSFFAKGLDSQILEGYHNRFAQELSFFF